MWFFCWTSVASAKIWMCCNCLQCSAPEVPHDITVKRAAIDNYHDEDPCELHSNDDESFMKVNDNNDETNSIVK